MKTRQQIVEEFTDSCMTMLLVDSWNPDVQVPPKYKNDSELTINFSRKFPNKLTIDEKGVSQKLTFDGQLFDVFIPWAAIKGALNRVTGAGVRFKSVSSIAVEGVVTAFPSCDLNPVEPELDTESKPTKSSFLRVIKGGKS